MSSKHWLLGASILLAATTPAQATAAPTHPKYLVCVVMADNKKLFLESGPIEVGGDDWKREGEEKCPAFLQYVIHQLGKTDASFLNGSIYDSREAQVEDLDDWHRRNATNPDLERIITGWRPDVPKPRPQTIRTPGPGKSARTPGLTVKTDTSLIDARKKWEQAVLQSQRDDAAARAKQVADAARNKAEMQAKLDKLFEQMRKRGSAQ